MIPRPGFFWPRGEFTQLSLHLLAEYCTYYTTRITLHRRELWGLQIVQIRNSKQQCETDESRCERVSKEGLSSEKQKQSLTFPPKRTNRATTQNERGRVEGSWTARITHVGVRSFLFVLLLRLLCCKITAARRLQCSPHRHSSLPRSSSSFFIFTQLFLMVDITVYYKGIIRDALCIVQVINFKT